MKRARKPTTPEPTPPPRRARPVIAVVVTLLLVGLAVFAIARVGDEARRNIGPRDRYEVRFADIRCDAPPGLTRDTFLVEVRYASSSPETLQLLAADLTPTLSAAFAAHPWVESVDAVSVEPPNTVSVKLTFRTPVLAVRTGDTKRAVDAKGVLLPANASTTGLAELLTPATAPGKAGQPWPDESVTRAASIAAEYKPKTIERTEQGWQLIQPDGKKLVVGR